MLDRAGRKDAVGLERDIRASQQSLDVSDDFCGTPLLPASFLGGSVETDFQGKTVFIEKPDCFGRDQASVCRERVSRPGAGFSAELLGEINGLLYEAEAQERLPSVEIEGIFFAQSRQKKTRAFRKGEKTTVYSLFASLP